MDTVPLKRSVSPSVDEDTVMEEPESKRPRIEAALPVTPPPEEDLRPEAVAIADPLFDGDPRKLLLRSIILALDYIGFDAATDEALESLCAEVDAYVTHFLYGITLSMLNARRSVPTPMDFQYALTRFDLPLASLEPHLKPPILASKSRIHLQLQAPEPQNTHYENILLGGDLSGESDKNQKPYIPRKFPAFPSKHTYKWTEKDSTRETDPRKIREEAAKAARQGEEALRRLTKISKTLKEKDVKQAASRDPRSKERHELWEKLMHDLSTDMGGLQTRKLGHDEDRSMIVNADMKYWRKPVPVKRGRLVPIDQKGKD
ncbi:transcription factor TFIID complex subunit 8 C-term-domain-containing protein [Xylogone sp. PMI_703]|nr:transcription factor TFIID complex subunit 8 C-term-domain-containing protein [Xylogone sp. PMI_703]